MAALCAVMLCSLSLGATDPLFNDAGVRPQAVRQGRLGSCYFHSAIAAIAASDPGRLKDAIETAKADEYRVRFADGKAETVYIADVQYARNSGFDLSDGLWVAVLFRGYAQRVLREALLKAVEASDFPLIVKSTGTQILTANDVLLLAYDRAIRITVDQDGKIDRQRLSTRLDIEMAALSLSADTRKVLLRMLDSKGYFDTIAGAIKTNGELFGAYRAVGQGGIPERVLAAFMGKSAGMSAASDDLVAMLGRAGQSHLPVIASSKRAAPPELTAVLHALPAGQDWFVEAHAYTVLGYDPSQMTITLRNPWARHPDPDGMFTISLDEFRTAYERVAFAEGTSEEQTGK